MTSLVLWKNLESNLVETAETVQALEESSNRTLGILAKMNAEIMEVKEDALTKRSLREMRDENLSRPDRIANGRFKSRSLGCRPKTPRLSVFQFPRDPSLEADNRPSSRQADNRPSSRQAEERLPTNPSTALQRLQARDARRRAEKRAMEEKEEEEHRLFCLETLRTLRPCMESLETVAMAQMQATTRLLQRQTRIFRVLRTMTAGLPSRSSNEI
ncbi:protein ORF44 [Cyprinid herpesvirus 2]|uniref:ORF44 n=1 Tax=Cyprinid herpesvirus 2 TaxID=317878 RepID=K7PBH8_CYHV2|nr:protein ORF44 [Cyprinid herpesvirus 2]AFJ20604.1 protein ORF44 [Cyprinid herpesvirus 2]AMB21615.1 ORF44 [Cyprinid herpesvirus 2]